MFILVYPGVAGKTQRGEAPIKGGYEKPLRQFDRKTFLQPLTFAVLRALRGFSLLLCGSDLWSQVFGFRFLKSQP